MSDTSQGEGWWQASDEKWYPPYDPSKDKRAVKARMVLSGTSNMAAFIKVIAVVAMIGGAIGVIAALANQPDTFGDSSANDVALFAGGAAIVQGALLWAFAEAVIYLRSIAWQISEWRISDD